MTASKASRAGLAPQQRVVQPPVDPRLRPWYNRCRADSERLATIQGHQVTVYQAKLAYQELRRVNEHVARLEHAYAELRAVADEMRRQLVDSGIQLKLPFPDQVERTEPKAELAPSKRGSKAAAAV